MNLKIFPTIELGRSNPFPKSSDIKKELLARGFFPFKHPQLFIQLYEKTHTASKVVNTSSQLNLYPLEGHSYRKVILKSHSELPTIDLANMNVHDVTYEYKKASQNIWERGWVPKLLKTGVGLGAVVAVTRFFSFSETLTYFARLGLGGLATLAFLVSIGGWLYYRVSLFLEKREVIANLKNYSEKINPLNK